MVIKDFRVMHSLMKRDFVFAFKSILIKSIFIGIVFLVMNLITIANMDKCPERSMNLIFQNLKGVPYFNVNDGFRLPMTWFLINFFIIFSLANYTYEDFRSNGKYVLTRLRKENWFYSAKVCWCICNVFIYYLMLFAIMIILSKAFPHVASKWVLVEGMQMDGGDVAVKLFLMYFTTSTALALLQNALSLILKPVYSYIAILVILAVSVFTVSNLLPGQHSLILRHVPFDNIHGLAFEASMLYNLVLSIFSIMAGHLVFSKKDIL